MPHPRRPREDAITRRSHPERATLLLGALMPHLACEAVRRAVDDPSRQTRAWPGAAPLPRLRAAGARAGPAQLRLLPGGQGTVRFGFDPSAFTVRPIRGRGKERILYGFLRRYHYSAELGMQGRAFGLFCGPGEDAELVGVATFGRMGRPVWAGHVFQPTAADVRQVQAGAWASTALAHRTVNESEYLELNRLALKPATETFAPLGAGAASWFIAAVLQRFERRNRALWLAQTALEVGRPLPPGGLDLLEEAALESDRKGTAFLKTVVSFADPWEGHVGRVYQALGFHHAGRSPTSEEWESEPVGLRSGGRLSGRTESKAHTPAQHGHDTTVLRLIWEGGTGEIRTLCGGRTVATDDGTWIRSLTAEAQPLPREIGNAWRAYKARMRERHGPDVAFETTYHGGGLEVRSFPPKHRYIRMLGRPYWQHELERRCLYLAGRMAARDRRWHARDSAPAAFWRGPLPDTRGGGTYPQHVPEHEKKPALRREPDAA